MIGDQPSIAIIGAGALGSYYGARLVEHGHDVHFLLRSDFDVVKRRGLVVDSADGDFTLPPQKLHVYDDPRRMPKVDLVIVTLKTTANDRYEPLIRPLLKDDTAILTLQNGLGNEERLAALFGAERILGGVAFVCINRVEPGHIRHTDHGLIGLGKFNGGRSPRADRICGLFSASKIDCTVLDSLRYGRWEKLVWNIPFNGLGATLDLTTDRLIGDPAGLELVTALMREVIAAAKTVGVELSDQLVKQKIDSTQTMGAYRSSMQVDIQQGRSLEVEAIVGEPLRSARRAGLETPCLAMLYRMLRLVNPGGL